MMKRTDRCPGDVKRAVRAFARAVKLVADMADIPSPDPQTEYHAKEYLEEMESLLLDQLLTAFLSEHGREDILEDAGLGHLVGPLRFREAEWEGMD